MQEHLLLRSYNGQTGFYSPLCETKATASPLGHALKNITRGPTHYGTTTTPKWTDREFTYINSASDNYIMFGTY